MKAHPSVALLVALLLISVAISVGTVFLLPLALVLFPFLPILGVLALAVLSRPGAGHVVVVPR